LEPVPALGLTSFDRSATDVYRWIRALGHPRSGAFSHLRGERVVLWSCERVGEHDSRLPAGTLLGVDGDGVVVTTRAGGVRLLEVQGEGRPPEPAAEWFHRRELPPGCAFEPVDWTSLAWVLPRS
jgi:methionyl-tRNA formyltransferase